MEPGLPDPREELAVLTADLLAVLDSWQRTGARVVATGPVDGLGEAPSIPMLGRGDSPPQRPPPVAPSAPRVAPVAAPASVRAAPPVSRPAPVTSPPVAPATITPSRGEAPPASPPVASPPSTGGLFGGRWAAVRDPDAALRAILDDAPATCPSCGGVPPRGAGRARATLAVVAAPLAGEAAVMFDRMLVHVLAMERQDVFLVAPGPCAACGEHVRRQVESVAPRAVLAMGEQACACVGAGVGRWASWAGRDVIGTHHPDTLVARAELKRAVFDHLKDLARRVG